ncbi:sensor histidine kinase [Parabacteroides distasonis]|uniref:sensor histidine kinase n=1 Tax=Parabacteroides distasonis TaxID=823 RepID=UPI001F0E2B9A|nr:two-component regulator propeller domain-containing protein [Parabacteroides distasonis]
MRIYLLLLFVLMITRAQATNVIFDRITMDSGLSSSSVTSILKDRTGYVWVGTTEGLNRYDGYTFKVFLPVPDCPESIQSSSIDKLFEDSDGGIWIFFSSGGISRYDRGSDTFLNFTKEWLRQQLRVYGSPTCFSASVPGHIFIGTENGMLEYDAKEKKLVRLSSAGSVVSSSPVNCLYSAPDHSFWVGTLAGFSLYDKETNHFQDYTIRTNDREDINAGNLNGVNAIYIDRFDYMWLGTGREGAFRSVDIGEREIFQSVGREDTRVYQFLETGDGDFWIGHNKGTSLISRMNRLALRCEHFFDRPEDLEPTGECQVRSIFESKDGTVWFDDSRFNQGLFYYSPKERKMGQLRNVPEDAHSISSNQITCLFLDDSDHLWAGHSTYGVSHADLTPSLFRYTLGYTEKENLSSLHILAVYEDSDLNLWVATSRGLDRINHKTSRVDMRFTFSPRKSPSSLSGKIIGSIREDSERNLWISYQDANPDRLNLDDFRIRPFIPDYQVSYDYPINSLSELCNLCVSEESWFWGGADEGRLRVWDTKTRALITYRYIPDEMNPLASNHIHCLFVDSSGYLWIGTNAGLDQYDKRTGRFDHFTVQDGLSGNIVRGIREGEPGILFVSTNKGLSRLDIQNRHIVNYTTANGLLSNEFMGGACCKRKSGELVFGSNEGIVSFDPVQLTDGLRKIPESLRITNLTIGDSREKQGLQVGFIAFDYSHPRSIRYRYRLDGYDTDWREVDASDRTAIYNRLPPGNYVFRVETSGNGSYWSAPITEPVRIFPPWWRTWWFILLVFVVVCVLLCIAYKSRVRWYQLRQAELECKIQERTRLLKQAKQELEEKDALKTRFFMNVSHELRTPLTIIKGLTEDLERHSGSEVSCGDKGILRTISRNTNRLIWHVNELLDLSVLTRGVPSPHIVCADLSRFL